MSSQVQVSPRYLSNPTGVSPFTDALQAFQSRNQAKRDKTQQGIMTALKPIAQQNTIRGAMDAAKTGVDQQNTMQVNALFDKVNSDYEAKKAEMKANNTYETIDDLTGNRTVTSEGLALENAYGEKTDQLTQATLGTYNQDNNMWNHVGNAKEYGANIADEAMKRGLSYADAQALGEKEAQKVATPGMSEAEKLAIQEQNKNQREQYKQSVDAQLQLGKTKRSQTYGGSGSGSGSGSYGTGKEKAGLFDFAKKTLDRTENKTLWDGPYDYFTGDSKADISAKIGDVRKMFPNDTQARKAIEEAVVNSAEGKSIDMKKIATLYKDMLKKGTLKTASSGGGGSSSKSSKQSFEGYKDPAKVQRNIEKLGQRLNKNTAVNLDKYKEKTLAQLISDKAGKGTVGNSFDKKIKAAADKKKADKAKADKIVADKKKAQQVALQNQQKTAATKKNKTAIEKLKAANKLSTEEKKAQADLFGKKQKPVEAEKKMNVFEEALKDRNKKKKIYEEKKKRQTKTNAQKLKDYVNPTGSGGQDPLNLKEASRQINVAKKFLGLDKKSTKLPRPKELANRFTNMGFKRRSKLPISNTMPVSKIKSFATMSKDRRLEEYNKLSKKDKSIVINYISSLKK